jgi:DNA repair protein RadC
MAAMGVKHYAIRDWPEGERPRERLLAEGPRRLTTAELLGIVLRTGARGQSAVDLARSLLQDWKSLADLEAAEPQALAGTKGMGPAKIAQIKAGLELGRRLLAEVERAARPRITSSKDVVELMAPRLRGLQVERCEIILLNGGNEVVALETLSEGSLTESPVYPREFLQRANRHHAAAVILAHNHPSGHSQPSAGDRALTEELVLVGDLLRIPLVDHVIIGRRDHYSFADRGLIEEYKRRPRRPA